MAALHRIGGGPPSVSLRFENARRAGSDPLNRHVVDRHVDKRNEERS